MTDARRFDFAGPLLRAPHRRESDGAMLCEAIVCREQVLLYRNADGSTRRELVTREAVDSMAKSIARCAVTLEHPPELVNADNVGRYGVGDVDGEVYVDEDNQGGFVRVRTAVRRRDAIDALSSGAAPEVSPGYTVVLDETPGTHPVFGDYDARQVSRTGNHLALTVKGRGDNVPIRADSADAVHVPQAADRRHTPNQEPPMGISPKLAALAGQHGVTVRTDMDEGDALDMLAAKVAEKLADKDRDIADKDAKIAEAQDMAPKADMDKMRAELDAMKVERDALQAKVDEYMEADKAAKDAEKMDSLKGVAAKLGVKLDDGVDLPAARRAIAATQVAELRADASDAYIDALVDVAAGKSAAVKPSRYDAWGAKPRPGAQRTDAASVPYVDAWSHHDSAHTQTHGGAK